MEDFGILKGTKFDFAKEWGGRGQFEDVLSEARLENYMNNNGLRYKMNKTQKEAEAAPKLGGGLLPEVSFTIPGLGVNINVKAPRARPAAFFFPLRGPPAPRAADPGPPAR